MPSEPEDPTEETVFRPSPGPRPAAGPNEPNTPSAPGPSPWPEPPRTAEPPAAEPPTESYDEEAETVFMPNTPIRSLTTAPRADAAPPAQEPPRDYGRDLGPPAAQTPSRLPPAPRPDGATPDGAGPFGAPAEPQQPPRTDPGFGQQRTDPGFAPQTDPGFGQRTDPGFAPQTTSGFTPHTHSGASTDPGIAAQAAVHGRVSIGDVLNGIYEVKRLIGRGGMAEVYEGVNINSDERVAIKVMLPTLAADPKVQAMFRKEARTLTRLSHPALVQYRVMAQEPRLNVLYIVTEFVDGIELTDLLGQITATSHDLRLLMRRLADGLRSAHDLGAVHRDLSPDNILLPEGRLDRAKVIDFGIAKDLDPTKATIVGDGFAGKLAYVAPEQFGDYGREIGPWTDIYSLGLVILAVAVGKDVDMGSTLVEAVDRRRAGIDVSAIPEDLRPVIERMLVADPHHRLRSMEEVLTLLDEHATTLTPTEPVATQQSSRLPPLPDNSTSASTAATPAVKKKGSPVGAIIGGVVALVVVGGAAAGGAWWWLYGGGQKMLQHAPVNGTIVPPKPGPTGPIAVPTGGDLQSAVATALPNLSCSWLDATSVTPTSVTLVGASGSPASVQDAVMGAAKTTNVNLPATGIDLTGVATADQDACSTFDVLRQFKPATGSSTLATTQGAYQIAAGPDGKPAGLPTMTLSPHNPTGDFALMKIEPNGKVSMIFPNRAALTTAMAKDSNAITDLGGDSFQVRDTAFNGAGWDGLLLISANGPIDASELTKAPSARNLGWVDGVRQTATAAGWKADMVWYRVQGSVPAPTPTPHPVQPRQVQPRTGYYTPPVTLPHPPRIPPPEREPRGKGSYWQRVFG